MVKSCDNIEPLLSSYLDGELDRSTAEAVELHVDGCAKCKALLSELGYTSDLIRTAVGARDEHSVDLDGVWQEIDSRLTINPSMWEKVKVVLGRRSVWVPLATATTALILVLLLFPLTGTNPETQNAFVESVYSGTGNVMVFKTPDTGRTLIWIFPEQVQESSS